MPKTVSVFARLTPPNEMGSISVMPCGPLVMFTGAFRLFIRMRMISPKPRVTIAR